MYAKIKLYNVSSGGFTELSTIQCSGVSISFNNQIVAKPSANGGSVVEVQKQSFENPIYSLQGVNITEISGSLTYAKLLEYAKLESTGSGNYLVLEINYSSGGATLPDSAGLTAGIKVVLRSYNVSIGLDKVADTGYRNGAGSITFIETK